MLAHASPCTPSAFVVERGSAFAQARLASPVSQCATCGGKGILHEIVAEFGSSYTVSKRCPRAASEVRALHFNSAQLPAVHAGSTFEGFKVSNAEGERALANAKQFAEAFPARRGYGLSGPVGCGKTHLLVATLRHLVFNSPQAITVAYVEAGLLFAEIRKGFSQGKSGADVILPLTTVPVLAIDELGKGRGSTFEMETLDELISRRYNGGMATLFGTNFSVQAPEGRTSERFDSEALAAAGNQSKFLFDRLGERIYSRLCGMCDFVEFPFDKTSNDGRRNRPNKGRL